VCLVYIKELEGKKIVDIAGQQHSLAPGFCWLRFDINLSFECPLNFCSQAARLVYVWGYKGYCRLGLGNQVDILKPKVVPQFAGPNESSMGAAIAAGRRSLK